MRHFVPVILALVILAAANWQAQAGGPGFVRGVVLQVDKREMSVRSNPGEIYRFSFDSRTWIERARERIPAAALHQGDLLEVVSDRDSRVPQYARMIHVLDRTPDPRKARRAALREQRDEVSYSGVTIGRADQQITLRTPLDGLQRFSLIPDTQFVFSGALVGRAVLEAQTHVLVRAVQRANGEMEAYQVIWGELLQPGRN